MNDLVVDFWCIVVVLFFLFGICKLLNVRMLYYLMLDVDEWS